MERVEELQDLGDLSPIILKEEDTGPGGVEPLVTDDGKGFGEASEAFREVLDEYYGDRLDELAGDGERVLVDRLVVPSDDVPHVEYQIVEERDND